MVQDPQLVVVGAGLWEEGAEVLLARLRDPKDSSRHRCMADQAVGWARIVPGLCSVATGRGNDDIFCLRIGDQIRVTAVWPPSIAGPCDIAPSVINQNAGLQSPGDWASDFIGYQAKVLEEDRSDGKIPVPVL